MSKKLYFLISFVLVLCLSGAARADTIEVNNPSFEYDINGVQITELTGWDQVQGWTIRDTTGWAAGWQFVDANWAWAEGYEAADGNVSSFNVTGDYLEDQNFSCQVYQVLDPNLDANSTIVANRRYTLRFNAIRMGTEDNPTAYGALFYSVGGVNVAPLNDVILTEKESVLTSPPLWDAGYAGWEEISLYYVALPGAGSIGERLGVKLSVPVHDPWLDGYQVMLDNVRVDWVLAVQAYDPFPDDGGRDVAKNVTLGWKPGVKVQPTAGHEVYFGTDETAVENADTSDTTGIYQTTRDVNNYTVPSTLVLGETYYWRVDEVNDLEGGSPWKGDVWSFRVTGYATNPSPFDGEKDVPFLNQSLMWTAGTEATSHDVYLGTDANAVADANTNNTVLFKGNQVVGDTDYPLTGLTVYETYYWRIDERSAIHPTGLKGDVWKFKIGEFLLVDNFDSYANQTALWNVWDDYWVNGSDGTIFIERTEVRSGKSMSFVFENTTTAGSGPSTYWVGSWTDAQDMTELDIGSDWTIGGVEALFMYVRGDPCNGPFADVGGKAPVMGAITPWVELEDTSSNVGLVLYDDANDLVYDSWNEWNIDLNYFQDVCGVTLSAIDRFTIGIGGIKGGQDAAPVKGYVGQAYFDDIRAYPPRCRTDTQAADYFNSRGDFSGPDGAIDCTVDEFDLEVMGAEWLVSDYNTMAAPPADPPEVWYRFDDGTGSTILANSGSWGSQYDIAVSAPNGVNEPAWTTDVAPPVDACEPNYARDFDGVGDYLEIPNSPATNFAGTSNMTMTLWCKGTNTDWENMLASRTAPEHATGLGIHPAGKLMYFWNNNFWNWASDLTVPANQWTFVAAAAEPTKTTLYVSDGTTVSSTTFVATHDVLGDFDTTSRHDIGSDAKDGGFYNGNIDDVRLYNKTLPIGEIMGLAGVAGEVYVPNRSVANIAPKTPPPTNPDPNDPDIVNFVDYEVLANNWLAQFLWP